MTPSPSGALIGTPSPGMLAQGSPGNPSLHVPSPGSFVPAPSPQSLGIHMPSPASTFISPQGKHPVVYFGCGLVWFGLDGYVVVCVNTVTGVVFQLA